MKKYKNIRKKVLITTFTSILGITVSQSFSYANDYGKNKKLYSVNETNIIQKYTNEIYNGTSKTESKIAYITIDDGPSKYTSEILEVLNKYNAKATFFMIDRNMKAYPNAVKSIIDNGNTPGFHSVTHDIHKLYKTSDSAKEEFDINKKTLLDLAGIESNIVRLPYGSKPYTPSKSYEALVEAGYKMWDWDIDTEDWKVTSEQTLENVKAYSQGKNRIVVLMHERKETGKSLDAILNYLSNEGYEFVPIDENETPKNYWLKNFR